MTEQTQTAPEAKTKTRQMTFTVLENGSVQASFPDSGLENFEFTPANLPEALYPAAMIEGVISVMRSAMGKLSGDERTASAMREILVKRWETLSAGQWKLERGESVGAGYSIEVEAAFLFRQKRAVQKGLDISTAGTLEEAAANFAALADDKIARLKADPVYKAAYAEIKAKRAMANAAKLAAKAEASTEDF